MEEEIGEGKRGRGEEGGTEKEIGYGERDRGEEGGVERR